MENLVISLVIALLLEVKTTLAAAMTFNVITVRVTVTYRETALKHVITEKRNMLWPIYENFL